jgi:hypothetical protein
MTRQPALLYLDFCLKIIWHGNIKGGNAKTTRTAQAAKKQKRFAVFKPLLHPIS